MKISPHTLAFTALLALSACGPDDKSEFSVLGDQVPGGVLLAMASTESEVIFVGGQLDGGEGSIVRFDEGALCYEEAVADRALWWIHAARAGEWYAVGEGGTIIHSVNGVRTVESVSTVATLYGVWDSGDRVIAVGGDVFGTGLGEVWVRDNEQWSLLADELDGVAFKVWNNWIVGDGIAYFLDGDTLEERHPPNGEKLLTVSGTSNDDVFAVGGVGTSVMLHWNGSAWDTIDVDPLCASQGLNGVFVDEEGVAWIAGFFGAMGAYHSDGSWQCPQQVVTFEHFHAVHQHNEEMLWAGGNMFDQGGNYATLGRYSDTNKSLTAVPCP